MTARDTVTFVKPPVFARVDQLRRFVRISDGASVVWRAAVNGVVWHATVDGIHAVCRSAIIVGDHDPSPSTYDRSNDALTCQNCADRVKRLKS